MPRQPEPQDVRVGVLVLIALIFGVDLGIGISAGCASANFTVATILGATMLAALWPLSRDPAKPLRPRRWDTDDIL